MMRRVLILCVLAGFAAPAATAADPPRVTVPPDMTVEAQSFAGAAVTYTASAFDDRGRPIPVSCKPASGSIFPIGRTSVTCTATDDEDTTTRRFTITVVDRTPPAVRVPASIAVSTSTRTGAIVSFGVTATDIVDGPVGTVCTIASGARFPLGVTNVTCNATDRRGNLGSAGFKVTVKLRSALFAPPFGIRVSAPPLLRWQAVSKAKFYNVQVYRAGRKILSLWPSLSRQRMTRSWQHQGRTFRLKPGVYTWYVWPGFGTMASPRFGKVLGRSAFRV